MIKPRAPRSPNGKRSRDIPTRSIRCDHESWNTAIARATSEGTTVSAVLNLFIKGYGLGKINAPKVEVVYDDPEPE